jgi:hypothetical protein
MIFRRSWVITEAVTAITGIARVRGSLRRRCLDPVHPRQLDIHEDERGRRRLGQPDPLLRGVGLDRSVAVELEDVALQRAVLLVVLDDQDELAGHHCA